jgi:hypothetical protein
MGCVAFLPQELTGSHKNARPHFPSNHIAPLVDEQRQIPVTVDPSGK